MKNSLMALVESKAKQRVQDYCVAAKVNRQIPPFTIGDTVDVYLRFLEGEKERIQVYTGVVIAIRGHGATATFTVRRIVQGEGVERIFPYESPRSQADTPPWLPPIQCKPVCNPTDDPANNHGPQANWIPPVPQNRCWLYRIMRKIETSAPAWPCGSIGASVGIVSPVVSGDP